MDDYDSPFQAGNSLLKANFPLIDMTFKLDVKKNATVYSGTVCYVCSELYKQGKGLNKVYQVPIDVHDNICLIVAEEKSHTSQGGQHQL